VRAPILLAASVIASITSLTVPADAQVRVARPRTVIASRPIVVSRPTVFVGGYYYPTFYRSSLWYDPFFPGSGPGYYGYYGPAYYQYPVYVGGGRGRYDNSGSIRLQISPRQAEVFVDGYFAGTVDDFDGVFQRLNIQPGEHEVQVYLAGYRSFEQRFYLQPGKSFNIKHTMEPLRPGEQASPRPDPTPVAGPPGDDGGRGIARGAGRGGRGEGAGRGEGGGRGARGEGRGGRAGGPSDGFGSLSLRVQPADADVLIDGEPWRGSLDNGPLVVQLGTGPHHIEIRREGYRSYLTDIGIVYGQTRTLNVALTKQ
jgi:PEGA domain-containing protein